MTTSTVSKHSRGAPRLAATLVAAAVLTACGGGGVTTPASSGGGGGGTTVTASPYLLFASNYQAFQAQTSGAFLASLQGGNVYAGSSSPTVIYGNYSAPQAAMDATQFYNIQWQWTVAGGGAGDYAYVSIQSPGSGTSGANLVPLDISQTAKLLIQMGNTYTAGDAPGTTGGNASVFTVVLDNDKKDGTGSTANCSYNQQLVTVGRNNAATATPTPLGVFNYVIPLSFFTTCSKGSIDTLKSTGVTSISVKITGDQNTGLLANELDTIAVGYVGFTL